MVRCRSVVIGIVVVSAGLLPASRRFGRRPLFFFGVYVAGGYERVLALLRGRWLIVLVVRIVSGAV